MPQLHIRPKPTLLQRTLPGSMLAALDSIEPGLGLARRFRGFKRLAEHPLFGQIHGRIVDHQAPATIARWVQAMVPADDELGSETMHVRTLERRLLRYRALIPRELMFPETYFEQVFRHAEIALDVVNEMGTLVRYQQQRITMFAEKEKDFPIPLEQQRKEILTLNELLKSLRDTQIALGITPGVIPGTPALTASVPEDYAPQDPIASFLESHPGAIPAFMAGLDQLMAGEEAAVTGPEEVASRGRRGEAPR